MAVKLAYEYEEKNQLVLNLRHLMQEQNINEATLARQTNIPQTTLHKIITGKTPDPRVSTLQILADYFNVTVDSLFRSSARTTISQQQTKLHAVPIISWKDCLETKNLKTLTPTIWDKWITIENTIRGDYALISKPCMEPRLPKGTVLIVATNTELQDGDLVVVNYLDSQEATIRELSIDGPIQTLAPLTTNCEKETLSDKIEILGVVIQSRFFYHN